jgi:hypothetical protein
MAVVKFGRSLAYMSNARWHSSDDDLAQLLQAVTNVEEVPTSEPDQDNAIAQRVALILGGAVTRLNDDQADQIAPAGVVF